MKNVVSQNKIIYDLIKSLSDWMEGRNGDRIVARCSICIRREFILGVDVVTEPS